MNNRPTVLQPVLSKWIQKKCCFMLQKETLRKHWQFMRKITPFPMILCDGCTAPCEINCKLCELGDGISIREVERAIVRYGEPGKRSSVFRMSKRKRQQSLVQDYFHCFSCRGTGKKMYPTTIYCKEKKIMKAILQPQPTSL